MFLDSLIRIDYSKKLFLGSPVRISKSKRLFLEFFVRLNFEKKVVSWFFDSKQLLKIFGSWFIFRNTSSETELIVLNQFFVCQFLGETVFSTFLTFRTLYSSSYNHWSSKLDWGSCEEASCHCTDTIYTFGQYEYDSPEQAKTAQQLQSAIGSFVRDAYKPSTGSQAFPGKRLSNY